VARVGSSLCLSRMASKTPARHRSRSEAKTPLTPSLVAALNNASLSSPAKRSSAQTKSHTSAHDTTNPFIAPPKSRPVTPVKRASAGLAISASLKSQASGGVIRRGGIESRLDVVTRDYVPPPKSEIKRSRSTPAVVSTLMRNLYCVLHCLT
jgi:cell division cycle protein 20 (cofactor of APC complex)